MGGGASLMENVEELMTTTILIGRAISAVQFPGMYRLYDFHSKKAPKLKNAQVFKPFFLPDSDDEDNEVVEQAPDESEYSHFFHVKVGEDTIYIEDVLHENEAGWTPLHACCMSLQTVEAGLAIIEEVVRRGGNLDVKTKMGPGTFNKEWSPLQMACAYGVEALVEKLVDVGADVNACNSFGYSCMLEACHRGYIVVAKTLLKGKVDLTYIPSEELSANSPFASAPCQSALAEAARSGFFKVVQTLLDAGAPKDLPNRLGWTALHEACFYNRVETVKTLLLCGCNATLRTRLGALPYHLACIPDIKAMLESMGGPEAVPNPGDTIDMLQILTELTMPSDENIAASFQLLGHQDNDEEEEEERKRNEVVISGSKIMQSVKFEPAQAKKDDESEKPRAPESKRSDDAKFSSNGGGLSPMKEGVIRTTGGLTREEAEGGGVQPALLHSGPLLGNLPAFGKKQASPQKFQHDVDRAFHAGSSANNSGIFGNPSPSKPSARADDKNVMKKKKEQRGPSESLPKDTPPEFLCQLTQRLMTEPVKTVYGNVYDRTAILNWLNTQGKICPLTGAPLAETDLVPNAELNHDIKKWILLRSTAASNTTTAAASGTTPNNSVCVNTTAATSGSAASNDDLYDF